MVVLGLAVVVDTAITWPAAGLAGASPEQLLDLLAFGGAEHAAIGTEELHAVPFGGIVAGGDLDAAGRAERADRQADRRRRRDVQVVYFAAVGQEAGQYGMAQNQATGSAVAAEHDAAAVYVSRERRGERQRRRLRQPLAGDAANAGDAHDQVAAGG